MSEAKAGKKSNVVQIVMTGLLVIAAFAIGSLWTENKLMKKGIQPTEQAQPGQPAPEEPKTVTEEVWQEMLKDPIVMKGEKKAKVTIVEFTDYQCPFCKRFVDETLSQIEKEYIDTGKVNYIIRDLPLPFHQFSNKTAEAAKCAGADQYLAYHDLLFANQETWSVMTEVDETLVAYANSLGINEAKFRECLTNGTNKEAVAADNALAKKAGLGGTPSFVINGTIVVGAQPYAQFKVVIDEALK